MNDDRRPDLRLVDPAVPHPAPVDADDRTLVRAAMGGSRQAWQSLVDRHLPDVWAWSVEATDTVEDGELVGQLVWLRLAQSLPWVVVDPVGAWLRQAVRDEAARLRRTAVLRAVPAQASPSDRSPARPSSARS